MKKLLSILLASVITIAPVSALAKSEALIDSNIAYMRQLLNESEFRIYRENSADNYVYYGAKFEPRAGAYIGTPGDKVYSGIANAINTEYTWFEANEANKNGSCSREERAEVPSDHTELIGVNWNFASQTYVNMSEYENYVKNFIDSLAARGKDVLLIFGKEMNIDDNFIDENTFIDAFRYVADYAHTKQNIAMVWAPNDTGGLDTRLIDFYPGNDYVDWIGCSLYSMPYFQGNPDTPEASNVGFIMGPYANPVMRAKVIVKFMEDYGINKPVFITEGGVGWYSPELDIDYTDWAQQQLRRYYGEICRRYPQFKCIVSFNNYYPGDYYRYDMGSNPTLATIYKQLTSDPIYLKSYPSQSDISYTELGDYETFTETIELSAYAYTPKAEWITVQYVIDGAQVAETVYPPYNVTLDNSQVSYGEHMLTVKEIIGDRLVSSKNITFNFVEGEKKAQSIYANVADNGQCVFTDMADKPAEMKNAVASLNEQGIINGVSATEFAPDKNLTRAEISAIILRMTGVEAKKGKNIFPDVTSESWYYDIASTVYDNGIISGFEDGTFRGDENLTKNQFAVMLARLLDDSTAKSNLDYADKDKIPSWAYESIQKMDKYLLKNNKGLFYGDEPITRGDCAIVLSRIAPLIHIPEKSASLANN